MYEKLNRIVIILFIITIYSYHRMTTTAVSAHTTFTLEVANREYTEWKWISPDKSEKEEGGFNKNIHPLDYKLFNGDSVTPDIKIVSSPCREQREICGVLLYAGITYGRHNASKNGKLLYKCIPDDVRLPCFFVPYEEPKSGFNKKKVHKYITFSFREWIDKHPVGVIENTFGEVDNVEAYTNYQLQCKELNASIKQFHTVTLRVLREKYLGPIPIYCNEKPIEDRRAWPVFSIDPKGCTDIDDALGIKDVANGQIMLSIYISNVPLMIEYLGLWAYMTDRIATIYLPSKKIPMLPTALSDNLCSLKEKEDRVAFVLDVYIKMGRILEVKCASVLIKVEKNYVYEEPELVARKEYQHLLAVVRHLNQESNYYVQYVDNVRNSHDVVEFCMILMNYECSKMLKARRSGIFRAATNKDMSCNATESSDDDDDSEADDNSSSEADNSSTDSSSKNDSDDEGTNFRRLTRNIKHIIQNTAGEYCLYENLKPHELISTGLPSYTHITSPIRRIVDCVNMLELQEAHFAWTMDARAFKERWMSKPMVDVINRKTKSTRKVQNEVELLTQYSNDNNNNNNKTIAAHTHPTSTPTSASTTFYTGVVFARTYCDKTRIYTYSVYLTYIKMLTTVTSEKKVNNYTTQDFTIHLFMEEHRMKRKIRLQMV